MANGGTVVVNMLATYSLLLPLLLLGKRDWFCGGADRREKRAVQEGNA